MRTMTKWSNPFGTTQGWNPWLELNEIQKRLANRFVPPVKNGDRDAAESVASLLSAALKRRSPHLLSDVLRL